MNLAPSLLTAILLSFSSALARADRLECSQAMQSGPTQEQAPAQASPSDAAAPESPPSTQSDSTVPTSSATTAPSKTETEITSQKCKKTKSGKCVKKSTATSGPKRVVVRNGSTSEPPAKLAPTVPSNVASQQSQAIEQLLNTAEGNLKEAVSRQLNADQTAMVEQVRNYIDQSRSAAKAGDWQRSNNLAVKARVLSDELVLR